MSPDRAELARRARASQARQAERAPLYVVPGPESVGKSARGRGVHYAEGDIERLPWPEFLERFEWRGGDGSRDAQHITIIAKTRDGKSHLASQLEADNPKPFVVVWAAKPPGDPALESLKKKGYRHVTRWPWRKGPLGVRTGPKLDPSEGAKVLFWPKIELPTDLPRVRPLFAEAMDDVFSGPWIRDYGHGWVERVDEGIYTTSPHFLAVRTRLEDHWQRIASQDSTLVFLCQRSSTVPLLAYDQVGHIFAGRCNDRRDAERVGEMASMDRLMVRDALQNLKRFEYLWLDVENDTLAIIKAPPPKGSSPRPRR